MTYDRSRNLKKIADALEEVFNPEELALCSTPLYRIAHALETIAKSMDSTFKTEEGSID
tara:strand:+ start:274 stop:450 length:177 start_codon:yes stop_codon:yes gene_type:complete